MDGDIYTNIPQYKLIIKYLIPIYYYNKIQKGV